MRKYLHQLIISIIFIGTFSFSQTNYSLSFDGDDDYVDCGNDPSLNVTEDFTIELWFKQTSWDSDPSIYNYLFSKRDGASTDVGIVISTNSDIEKLNFWISRAEDNTWGFESGGFSPDHIIQLNQWYHVAVVFSGSEIESFETNENITIYLNGLEQNIDIVSNFTGTIPDHSNAPLTIGNRSDLNRPFPGFIDEVRLWDKVCSETEIRENIFSSLVGDEDSLIGYWNFNEGSGTTAVDGSQNINDGSIQGATYSIDGHPNTLPLVASFVTENWYSSSYNAYMQIPPNNSIQFTDKSFSSDSIISWNWDFGDGVTSSQQNPSHSYAASGLYSISLIVVDVHDSSATIVKEQSIEVNPLATITSPTQGQEFPAYSGQINVAWTSHFNFWVRDWRLDWYKSDSLLSSYLFEIVSQHHHDDFPNFSIDVDPEAGCGDCSTGDDYKFRLNVFLDSDSGWVESDNFTIINPMPTAAELIYPTAVDTFSTHVDNNIPILFNWHPSQDDNGDDILYKLTIQLEYFGNSYTEVHENISDTTISIMSNALDPLMNAINPDESILNWYVESYDGTYTVISNTNQFFLSQSVLSTNENQLYPKTFALHQNYPNPFNPITQIKYDLPEDAMVSITIYDIMGRSIKSLVNSNQSAGYRSIQWNATNNLGEPVSAGLYLYTIQAGKFRQVRKMVLLK
jgi:PKD repeat protein